MLKFTTVGSVILVLLLCSTVFATPTKTGAITCGKSGCHDTALPAGALTLTTTLTAHPTFAANKTNLGTLPVYNTTPGGSITVTFQFFSTDPNLAIGDGFALSLKGIDQAGVGTTSTSTNKTNFTKGSSTWTDRNLTPDYWYTTSVPAYTWNGTTVTGSVVLNVGASTPADYYALTLTAGGADSGGSPIWNATESFYVNVIPEPITVATLGIGAVGLLLKRRRRMR